MSIVTKAEPADNPSGALILYDNLLVDAPTFAINALTPNTYERWVDSAGNMLQTFQLATPTIIDTICIGAHNMGTKSVTVTISVAPTIAGSFTEIGTVVPVDDKPIMFNFDPTLVADVKFLGTVISGDTDKEVGIMYAGNSLQMPRNIYGGHSPMALSQVTEYQATMSESGQFLGKNIIRKGLETSFNWQFLDDQFYRDSFQPFVESARTLPFFIKWRPDFYSEEIAFGEVNQDITPSNMGGGHRLMSVGFTMTAHSDL